MLGTLVRGNSVATPTDVNKGTCYMSISATNMRKSTLVFESLFPLPSGDPSKALCPSHLY